MADEDLAWRSATQLITGYARGDFSPTEVHRAVRAVVERREPVLNALAQDSAETSERQAAASTERWVRSAPIGPLDGVPITVKENVARRGIPLRAGNAGSPAVLPTRDAPITERVLGAGAVVLGSTVMPDWGMLSSGVSSLHGISRSPLDPTLTTGGSSSGAGAAAAGGYGPLHVGTDIGGSIRLPGTWLGLATLKPSDGRVPLDTPYLGRVAGPLARSVEDIALLMRVIAQPDPRDWASLPATEIDWEETSFEPRGLRVGLLLDAGCGLPVDPEVRRTVEAAATVFSEAGAEVVPLEPWMSPELLDALDTFWRVRSYADLVALDPQAQARVLPFIVRWVTAARDVSGLRLMECYTAINTIRARTVAATQPYDLVLSPVAPMAAFPAEWPMPWGETDQGMAHIGFTAPYNLSGQPAATVNAGFTTDGRTVGVQLIGRRFDDAGVLRAARWYEAHRPAAVRVDWRAHDR
ncbi:amidase [Luteipulveratus sp. YIM 133132]|uniref:Amidase n=1 Tax=Luteipulveratus flavus TaxID=3031728 RepID=A0ABT6C298_9MICO|nr:MULTISPECIES: amidase [unclassified Luteipulveratus]MDE9364635.1 amidase [Luteipulveratus sp. YIM 133132]MDF8262795.1 amidase [Luteipulveratus sp. YIM 133296]